MSSQARQRDEAWTKSLAVGNEEFVMNTREILGARGRGRSIVAAGDTFVLGEAPAIDAGDFAPENRAIAPNNSPLWDEIS